MGWNGVCCVLRVSSACAGVWEMLSRDHGPASVETTTAVEPPWGPVVAESGVRAVLRPNPVQRLGCAWVACRATDQGALLCSAGLDPRSRRATAGGWLMHCGGVSLPGWQLVRGGAWRCVDTAGEADMRTSGKYEGRLSSMEC